MACTGYDRQPHRGICASIPSLKATNYIKTPAIWMGAERLLGNLGGDLKARELRAVQVDCEPSQTLCMFNS
jgi:hypothetical protein